MEKLTDGTLELVRTQHLPEFLLGAAQTIDEVTQIQLSVVARQQVNALPPRFRRKFQIDMVSAVEGVPYNTVWSRYYGEPVPAPALHQLEYRKPLWPELDVAYGLALGETMGAPHDSTVESVLKVLDSFCVSRLVKYITSHSPYTDAVRVKHTTGTVVALLEDAAGVNHDSATQVASALEDRISSLLETPDHLTARERFDRINLAYNLVYSLLQKNELKQGSVLWGLLSDEVKNTKKYGYEPRKYKYGPGQESVEALLAELLEIEEQFEAPTKNALTSVQEQKFSQEIAQLLEDTLYIAGDVYKQTYAAKLHAELIRTRPRIAAVGTDARVVSYGQIIALANQLLPAINNADDFKDTPLQLLPSKIRMLPEAAKRLLFVGYGGREVEASDYPELDLAERMQIFNTFADLTERSSLPEQNQHLVPQIRGYNASHWRRWRPGYGRIT